MEMYSQCFLKNTTDLCNLCQYRQIFQLSFICAYTLVEQRKNIFNTFIVFTIVAVVVAYQSARGAVSLRK